MERQEDIIASFKIVVRCHNCRHDVCRRLDVPNVEDAPTTVDELIESAFMSSLRYSCEGCETPIGTVISIAHLGFEYA